MDYIVLETLAKKWKIDISDNDWENQLKREFKWSKYTTLFSYILGLVILVPSIGIIIVALFAEGSTFFGVEMTEKLMYSCMIITCTSALFLKVGVSKLRQEQLGTLLFLGKSISQDVNNS